MAGPATPIVAGLAVLAITHAPEIENAAKKAFGQWSQTPQEPKIIPHTSIALIGCGGKPTIGLEVFDLDSADTGNIDSSPIDETGVPEDQTSAEAFNTLCHDRATVLQDMYSAGEATNLTSLFGETLIPESVHIHSREIGEETNLGGMSFEEMASESFCPAIVTWDENSGSTGAIDSNIEHVFIASDHSVEIMIAE